ncbi:ABATE domain-containing protein [Isoptericola halotolerans]|uniref:CGNR zinc finger domain-containing protein n=1 Tax=Isoptericola halotolerans TaxID=300560 RepID=UPI00388DEAF7
MDFAFVSGDPALDLVGTVLSREDQRLDLLGEPGDLERWIARCEPLPDRVTVDETSFAAALSLREAVHRLALDRVRGRSFDPRALGGVNAAAAGPAPAVTLGDDGIRREGDLRAVLAQIARGAVDVLGDPGARLKECARPGCTRLFLDRSRGARRTWCGMDGCGNRVKAAAYRARRRAASRGPGAGSAAVDAPLGTPRSVG